MVQIRGAEALQIPVVVTEQYPKALGKTVEELQAVLSEGSLVQDKFDFTMCGTSNPSNAHLDLPHRSSAIVVDPHHLCCCSAACQAVP